MSYKGFKKISQDAKTTTFQHPNGSELKVAHGHISPELKKRLDALPMHMAKGGGTDDDDKFTFTGDDKPYTMASAGDQPYGLPESGASEMSVAAAPTNNTPTANSGIQVNPAGSVDIGATSPDQVNTGDQPNTSTPPAPAPVAQTLDQPQSQAPAPKPPGSYLTQPQPAAQTAQEMNQEYAAAKQDYGTGQITPETYQQYFAKKDTLGKVGTLFGLLISGAGSGLTHQPNAVLQMMDKQIDRDLDAQKATKSNQFNALNLANAHMKNLSDMSLQGAQKGLIGAQTQEAQQNAQLAATNVAKGHMMLALQQKLIGDVSAIPPGPQRQAAESALNVVSNGIDQHMYQKNAQTAAQIEANFQRRNAAMNMVMPEQAKYEAEHHIPLMTGKTSEPVTGADRDQLNAMNVLDAKGKDLLSYIDANKGIKGALGTQTKNAARQKLAELLSFYNQSVQGGQLTAGRLGWYDEQLGKDPTGVANQLLGGDTARLKEVVSSNALRRDNMLTGKLGYTGPETEKQPEVPPSVLTSKKGHPMVMGPNGKLVYK